MPRLTRDYRVALAAALALLAGCGAETEVAQPGSITSSVQAGPAANASVVDLEVRYGAQVGLFAVDTGTGRTVTHRADERFPFLSTFKTLAAAALLRSRPLDTGYFDRVVRFHEADLVANSPVTSAAVAEGMTLAQVAEAAITRSDNTAGNLLLREIGGPEGLTAFLRTLGDPTSRLDRWETELNTAIPGDERDTTTAAALAADYRAAALGDALGARERDQLVAWLKANTTGDKRIRAGLPAKWVTGDKTGTGSYGCANDVAIVWPEGGRAPVVIAILTRKSDADAEANNDLLAEVTKVAVNGLR
ncbi:class A beta-lactamase [Nocardia sputorum]|uniref:Beta-lactamase n=1 Tax=Nocardia sputorum TaxID=2984338 RepID=A0ABN6UEJ8_9NOCA|nr:class A beta-lactamase [Nocardia sputorum]BDT92966.1 beta-lactamase [Nocardia sputorum]BDU03707.1 beta-lactamase [Nocardia sputorum]